jgi:aryl-alcohol dehydrogenase-like predicted oxidoreductase
VARTTGKAAPIPLNAPFGTRRSIFSGDAGKDNEALVEQLRAFAAKGQRTSAQLWIAWALANRQGPFDRVERVYPEAQMAQLDSER